MCDKEVSKYIYKCGHETKKFIRVKRCPAAEARDSDCTGNDLKEKEIGSSRRKDDCEQCNDEGYSR
jgi:hypothetical protein